MSPADITIVHVKTPNYDSDVEALKAAFQVVVICCVIGGTDLRLLTL